MYAVLRHSDALYLPSRYAKAALEIDDDDATFHPRMRNLRSPGVLLLDNALYYPQRSL